MGQHSKAWRQRRAGLGDAHQLWLGEAVPRTEARTPDEIICTKCHVRHACLSPRDRTGCRMGWGVGGGAGWGGRVPGFLQMGGVML